MAPEEMNNALPPELLLFSGNTDEWVQYQENLFVIFRSDLLQTTLLFRGLRVNPRRFPEFRGKHFTFWHIISEGDFESERFPDLRRCERIRWIAWIIANCDGHDGISYWESKRGSSQNFVLWYEKGQFVVILAKRSTYFVLLSAYHVTDERRIATFKRDRDAYLAKKPKS